MTATFGFRQIGVVRSPYKEKFTVPRQPGLVADGVGELHLLPPYNQAEAVRGLTEFSHIWLLFVFHQTPEGSWRPTVRPPRLGGNSRMGVFATRSPFRPNPIGMSLVALEGITLRGADVILRLGSLDLVDGTPVVDIKPYLPYAESLPDARAGFAQAAPADTLQIIFSPRQSGSCARRLTSGLDCGNLSAMFWRRIPVPPITAGNAGAGTCRGAAGI
ncbi:hypothetical protein SODG_001341 [Sodalis praecaptivus]